MKNRSFLLTCLVALLLFAFNAQAQKRPMDGESILKWNRITEQRISNDGEIIVYKTQPWKGDSKLYIVQKDGTELASFPCGTRSAITQDSKFVVFNIVPDLATVRSLKLKKTKKADMPKTSLAVYDIEKNKIDTITAMKSFELPAKWAGYLAYQVDQAAPKKEKKEAKEEKESDDQPAKKEKKEGDKTGRKLYLKNLLTNTISEYPFVTSFQFAPEKEKIVFITTGEDDGLKAGIYQVDVLSGETTQIIEGEADYSALTITKDGTLGAFLADMRDKEERKDSKEYEVYQWSDLDQAVKVIAKDDSAIPENWEISNNSSLSFSNSGQRLFFGIAPIPPEKDTTVLEEEKPVLDIWHWNEPQLQTVQLKRKGRDARKTLLSVRHLDLNKTVILADQDYSGIRSMNQGDGDWLIAWSNLPYAVQSMWEGSPGHNDLYLVNMMSGEREMIKQDIRATPMVSPLGQYLYWYLAEDSTYVSYDLKTRKEYVLTTPASVQVANELNDIPNLPSSYGVAGWLKEDKAMVVYDRFNIWKLDPRNKKAPINLTNGPRSEGWSYRIIDFDRSKSATEGMDLSSIQLLKGHNEITRADGYFTWNPEKQSLPKVRYTGNYKISNPTKAKNAEQFLFTYEDFQKFPDLQTSNGKFKKITQLSVANPQEAEFHWGTAELVKWTSLDGRKLEGTLHKPADFDPNKKYPLLVNFYEKSSQGLFGHHIPERGRSTIDYHYYTSHGYLIFNPDVYYKEGYPGEDAFNCVMPGITALIEKGFVNEKAIGAQGHSWGGYQVAYLATRTNLFAAIESGAPVVNMFSAYGGIRWGSGMNRSFQYEHTQSRIGKSIWESPLRYLENSPLFTLDKVNTPILIMHNDDDGAVPWYQGIEYFIGLRRLGKPAWLLNYNNADHWPTRLEDKHDFQIRLAQFFDHYLKGAPMPEWMEKGIPATEKGTNLGY